ncbi:hypothetical protein [Nostoc sp. KVJ3]|uniref:hypothetical protein n=1 Tax=Nostoc sp. KVJ3 TaxID=457945 RepID=UPI002238C522|nr:hypothetical protein [Nostoc sp. KVJ3]
MKMTEEQWRPLMQQHWLMLKQRYPIGCKFWAKVGQIRPFGIIVEVDDFPKDRYKYIGTIDVGHTILYKEGSQQLPPDPAHWPQEGTCIYCMVCYYREHDNDIGQLGLSWLGQSSQPRPEA